MPAPKKRYPNKPVRRRVRNAKRYGFRRVMAFLLVLFGTELAWRAGAFAHPREHVKASPVVAAHHAASPGHAAVPSLASMPPLAGPPVATSQGTRDALDRMISLGYPVKCGGGTKPLVALTFDDGPGLLTPQTVDLLRRAGAKATFFIVAKELIGWPQLADEPRAEARVGAIGDHTYDHIGLDGLSSGNLSHQIADAKDLIEQHSGVTVRLFRPPYGQHDANVDREVRDLGMLQVLWTVDSGDGLAGSSWRTVLDNVRAGLRPGAIVLLHENRGTTQRALPQILRMIHDKGLHTVTVPELLAADPPSISQLKAGTCH